MTEADVMQMVQREVVAIWKRDGELPKTPYLWAEVLTRLATVKPWTGMRAGDSVGRALRPLVEAAAIHVKFTSPKAEEPTSPAHMPPLDAAEAMGITKSKHMKGKVYGRQFNAAS